ncbi:MAG: tyrosine recombinase XerD [Deltaproteobacteria bacterium]|jgi:integrase/recombinase XerD|nr:tyrosine recombinase XerD [Deltaproteobacteria bacterium]
MDLQDSPLIKHLDFFLAHLRVERSLSGHTLEAYGRAVRDLLEDLAQRGFGQSLGEVKRGDLIDHLTRLAEGRGLSPRSVCLRLAAIRGFFKFLAQERVLADNPAAKISKPKNPKTLPKSLSGEETAELVAFPNDNGLKGLRDRAMLELMYAAGLRVSELLSLTLSQVNLPEAYVRAFGKGQKERIVPIGQTAVELLERYLTLARPRLIQPKSGSVVFLTKRGLKMSRQYFWRLVKELALTAGLPPVSPHVLRHSFATHLVEGGADLRAVQLMLGHANLSTTEVYLKTTSKRLRKVHDDYHPRSGVEKR